MGKKRRKIVKGRWKIENGGSKSYKIEEKTFFFFCFSLFKTTKICFGSTKMEIFYREKTFHAGENKNQEKWLCPLRKIFLSSPCENTSRTGQRNLCIVGQLLWNYRVPNYINTWAVTKEFKGGIGSPFDPCVNAMRQQPYWPSRMEVSYCSSGFGAIIQRNLHTTSLPCDSPCDNLCACIIWVHAVKATHT